MKRVTVVKGQIGLVYRDQFLVGVLESGNHWIGFGKKVQFYSLTERFKPSQDIRVLKAEVLLADYVQFVEVADNQICLQYENNRFVEVLTPGLYAYWNGLITYNFSYCDLSKVEITESLPMEILKNSKALTYLRLVKVEPYQKAILFIDSKIDRILSAGIYYFWNNEISVEVVKADMRMRRLEISGQEMLTKDKASLRINYELQFQIIEIEKALLNTENFEKQLYMLAQLALRSYVGTKTLDEILENREKLSEYVQIEIQEESAKLGLVVNYSGIKDVILVGEMKEIMNRVLIAQKQAEANVIMRREETASTRSLLNTAKLMEENTMLFKLKEMEYIEKIAEKINNISIAGGSQVAGQLKELFSST